MKVKAILLAVSLGVASVTALPVAAQTIGHSVFMRGQIVSLSDRQAVLCIGKADGATASQVLDVYRVGERPGSPNKGMRIDHVFDDHFAHATVLEGAVAKHDIVELRRAQPSSGESKSNR